MTEGTAAAAQDILPVSTVRQAAEDLASSRPPATGAPPASPPGPGPGTVRDILPTTPRPERDPPETQPSEPATATAQPRDPYHPHDPPGAAATPAGAPEAEPTEDQPSAPPEGEAGQLAEEERTPPQPATSVAAQPDPARRGPVAVTTDLAGTIGRKLFGKEKTPPGTAAGETDDPATTPQGETTQAATSGPDRTDDPADTEDALPPGAPAARLIRTIKAVEKSMAETVQRDEKVSTSLDLMSDRIKRSVEDLTAPSASIHREAETITGQVAQFAETAGKLDRTVASAVQDIRREGSGPATPRWFVLLAAAMLVTLALAAGLAAQRYAGILPVPDAAWREYVWDTHGAEIARCVLDARRTGGECRVSAIVE